MTFPFFVSPTVQSSGEKTGHVKIYGVSAQRFIRDLYRSINDDNVFNGAAALGSYLTLAIFPALVVTMTILPYLPIPRADQAIMDLLKEALPNEASDLVSQVVHRRRQYQAPLRRCKCE